jgi:D-alanyl-D-alanine dipeptidase
MWRKTFVVTCIFLGVSTSFSTRAAYPIPASFVDLQTVLPNVILDIRYHGSDNFIGRPIDGYLAPKALLSREAALAIAAVQREANAMGFQLKIFDAYRPQAAVNHFVRWASVIDDTLMKARYYPDVEKKDLFALKYIAERSGHTRGSTIDLTLVDMATGEELDMGSSFDLFGEKSHHGSPMVNEQQSANRMLLKELMLRHGFKHYPEEWWHYTLANEPYPDTYFDFPVK